MIRVYVLSRPLAPRIIARGWFPGEPPHSRDGRAPRALGVRMASVRNCAERRHQIRLAVSLLGSHRRRARDHRRRNLAERGLLPRRAGAPLRRARLVVARAASLAAGRRATSAPESAGSRRSPMSGSTARRCSSDNMFRSQADIASGEHAGADRDPLLRGRRAISRRSARARAGRRR